MNMPVQALSALFPHNSIESNGFAIGALQKALALQPSLAYQAAAQAVGGVSTLSPTALASTSGPLNSLSGAKTHTDAQLKEVSKNFEAIFMRMLFKDMRNTVQKSGVMGTSQALDFFETMRDEQLSDHLASAGGLGIGNMIYQKLKEATVPHQKSFR